MKRIAIIGAGAAGCFCAANLRKMAPEASVTLFEAGPKPLAKLAITGGGRCNLTNSFEGIRSLKEAYPRGERVMKRALKEFSVQDTLDWFTAAGVPLTLQEDHCYFPVSQNAMDVVRCLQRGIKGCELKLNALISEISPRASLGRNDNMSTNRDNMSVISSEVEKSKWMVNGECFDYVVITGGGGSIERIAAGLKLETVPPVPSLFTFNIKDKALTSLMGLVVDASVSIPGSGFKADGPLLITDWGLSGPAVLKLSSYAARYLSEAGDKAPLSVNWLHSSESEVRDTLAVLARENAAKLLLSTHLLPSRLWEHIVLKAGLRKDIRWGELGSKGMNKLVATLVGDNYFIEGKSKFREEFVTCGGVSLDAVELGTLQSKKYPGLYFAGEVLDIDAITGGFNLQAAWSTGYVVAKSIVKSL
ncbi:MAG: aminoacetone oxidase family FAD-binding enzyme [Bacteroidales bacterium]|nr:aminoacetone oxidase family FAD-binding enzyme [Bacteroidales bacterium]